MTSHTGVILNGAREGGRHKSIPISIMSAVDNIDLFANTSSFFWSVRSGDRLRELRGQGGKNIDESYAMKGRKDE